MGAPAATAAMASNPKVPLMPDPPIGKAARRRCGSQAAGPSEAIEARAGTWQLPACIEGEDRHARLGDRHAGGSGRDIPGDGGDRFVRALQSRPAAADLV